MRERIGSSLIRTSSGQSILEFALVLPLLFLLIVNVVNYGGLLYAYITVANASRSGASYMSMGNSSAYGPDVPTVSQIQGVVHADMASLPRGTTAPVAVCGIQLDGTTKWISSYPATYATCTMPSSPPTGSTFTDPQSSSDMIGTVQVQYRYCPFVKGWILTLPDCSADASSGGTTITRVAAMRILQQ